LLFDLRHIEMSDCEGWNDNERLKDLLELVGKYRVNSDEVIQGVMDANPELYDEPKPKEEKAKATPKKAAKKATKKAPAKKAAKPTGKSAAANDVDFTDEEVDKLATVLADTPDTNLKPAKPGTCRFCGCTDDKACEGGCAWIDETRTVCSSDECCEELEAEREAEDDDFDDEEDEA
jgi:hypothetical protein